MPEIKLEIPAVINTCYGGYGLSFEAQSELAKRKGWNNVEPWGHVRRCLVFPGTYESVEERIPRNDPDLIALFREWGSERMGAMGSCLELSTISVSIVVIGSDGMEKIDVYGFVV